MKQLDPSPYRPLVQESDLEAQAMLRGHIDFWKSACERAEARSDRAYDRCAELRSQRGFALFVITVLLMTNVSLLLAWAQ